MSIKNLQAELQRFTGTENWYRHAIFASYSYTDGVRHLARNAGAYWLIDRIIGLQYDSDKLVIESFQVWDLICNEDESAWLLATDGNRRYLHREKIPFTDFPLPDIRLYLTDRVLLLPSEY